MLRYRLKVKEKNDKEVKDAQELEEKVKISKGTRAKKVYELNLEPDYWRTRHVYPYALEPVPLKQPGQNGGSVILDGYNFNMSSVLAGAAGSNAPPVKINVVETTALQYPMAYILPKIEKKKKLTSSPTEVDEDGLNVDSLDEDFDSEGEFKSYEEELAQPLNISVQDI